MHPSTRTGAITALALALTGVGCGGTEAEDVPTPPPAASSTPATPSGPTPAPEEHTMRITFASGDQRFDATLVDSAAAQDLLEMLPVTIDMADHGGVEKTGPLPVPLSLEGQPDGADPEVGDLGYYAPGNDLVLYYGDQGHHPGIVVLGRLGASAAEQVAAMPGTVRVTVEVGR